MVRNPVRDPAAHVGKGRASGSNPPVSGRSSRAPGRHRDLRPRDGVRESLRKGDGVTTEERNVLERAGLDPEIWEALA